MLDTEPRYDLVEACGRIFLVDSFTGALFILTAQNSASPKLRRVRVIEDGEAHKPEAD